MHDVADGGLPEIDTSEFEQALSDWRRRRFRAKRPAFLALVRRLIAELGLQGQIEHLTICSPVRGRAELYREPENPWPSKRLHLDIYEDRYMDERLLRHELGHEADRRNTEMLFDPDIDERWKQHWAFDMATNISLDVRPGDRGLGKEYRRAEFHRLLGEGHDRLFEEAWANPPITWPRIEELATKISKLKPEQICQRHPAPIRSRRRALPKVSKREE